MMLIILVTGTVLIMLNLPLIIVILGTILGGAIGLLITGSISIKREKKEKKKKPEKEKKEKGKGLFSGLKGALKRDRERIASSGKEEEIKKIDEMLVDAIGGKVGEEPSGAAAKPAKLHPEEEEIGGEQETEEEKDLLLALSEEDFGDDIFDEIQVGEENEDFPPMGEDELDKHLLIGGAESVDDILAAHATELEEEEGELPDITGEGGLEAASALDSLDLDEESLLASNLDELDLEEEEEEPEEIYGLPDEFEGEEEEPEEIEEMEGAGSGDLEMISFASGIEEDEMISELKSQKKKKRQEVDVSLVRELRDVKIDVNELEGEMEEVLGFLNKQKEKS